MTGYQELVTDPSYAGQILCFTAPMVGNYGVAPERSESAAPQVAAVVMREARGPAWTDWLAEHGVVGLTGVDTRALVLHLRDHGAMRAGHQRDARRDPRAARDGGPGARGRRLDRGAVRRPRGRGRPRRRRRLRLQALDRQAPGGRRRRGHRVPARRRRRRAGGHDGVAPLQRARRPRAARGRDRDRVRAARARAACSASASATSCSRWRRATRRTSCRSATAARTTRCSTGRPGACSSRARTTASRCGRADERAATHVSLYDGTVEGLDYPELRARSLQFHPEAGPGPHDARPLIESWVEEVRAAA